MCVLPTASLPGIPNSPCIKSSSVVEDHSPGRCSTRVCARILTAALPLRRLGAAQPPWPLEGSVSSGKDPIDFFVFLAAAQQGERNCHPLSRIPTRSSGTIVHATPLTPCAQRNETRTEDAVALCSYLAGGRGHIGLLTERQPLDLAGHAHLGRRTLPQSESSPPGSDGVQLRITRQVKDSVGEHWRGANGLRCFVLGKDFLLSRQCPDHGRPGIRRHINLAVHDQRRADDLAAPVVDPVWPARAGT